MTTPIVYPIPARGYATAFSESETPPDYALEFKNRFINGTGNAEKRQGEIKLGPQINGAPPVTGIHELVLKDGERLLLKSAGDKLYLLDEVNEEWSQVKSGLSNQRLQSVQMDDKLIFFNGVDRNFFTRDGETFEEMQALVEVGRTNTGTTANQMKDAQVSAWATETNVAPFDIIFYPTLSATTMITRVSGNALETVTTGPTGTGIANTPVAPSPNIEYRIVDTVELNIIPTGDFIKFDNVAVAASGSSTTVIKVDAVSDWTKTELRVGDYIYNTVRNTATQVTSIASSALTTLTTTGTVAGDSLTFHKSAMPIAQSGTVRFGRLYLVDSRDRRKVRISGPLNPFDFTNDAANFTITDFTGGISSGINTFDAGSIQPEGDVIQGLATFQNFFIVAGKQNMYVYAGINPVGEGADFFPVAVFPQGCVSPYAFQNIGNDFTWISPDGVQSFAITSQSSSLKAEGLSVQLNNRLRSLIKKFGDEEIQLFQYPRRSWLIAKFGGELYVLNYSPLVLSRNPNAREVRIPSWYLFEGRFASHAVYFVDSEGDLLTGGVNATVFRADEPGVFTDDGEQYITSMKTAWLTTDEPRNRPYVKTTKAIEPIFETGTPITYTIRGEGDWDERSRDEVEITADGGGTPIFDWEVGADRIGGSPTYSQKYPMRLRGRAFRFQFITSDDKGPDIIGRWTIYANKQSPE